MSFIGGIIGVIMSLIVYRYRHWRREYSLVDSFLSLADTIVPIVPIGIMLGRFGNYLNQELYGRIVDLT